MKYVICYVSNASEKMEKEDIGELLSFCEEKNELLDVKGLLLFSEGNFFQVMEGQKDVVLKLWEKIKEDKRHNGIIQVVGRDIQRGAYDGYKAEILGEDKKFCPRLPMEYLKTIKGMSPEIKRPIERILENFLITRI